MTDSSLLNLRHDETVARAELISASEYSVKLDLRYAVDRPERGFRTESVIKFNASAPQATFLDFVGQSVDSVELNGKPITVDYDGARIHFVPSPGENVLSIVGTGNFSSSGEGLHRFVDPADAKIYLYTQFEPTDARRVYANFEQPDLKARFSFTVTAPSDWVVASNGALSEEYPDASSETLSTRSFKQTEPISTYITCVIAGEYAHFADEWRSESEPHRIPLALYARRSLAKYVDSTELFELTKAGLDYYHELFKLPYPFGKYDQAFVPEYNLGAMENPGLVTFTDDYIFSSAETDDEHQGRANTLMHEMAHMWFGDLVTMRWWDDLWLKESFADYMGARAVADTTRWGDASWVSFAKHRKAWAYVQDQLPTTHPIVASIPDLEAARQNFDGITYAKGASALKQLVAYVGSDMFFEAAQTYFAKHAYANTTMADFLAELSSASGRDITEWSRLWLTTAGVSTLSAEVEAHGGKLTNVVLRQEAVDPRTNTSALRPHQIRVAGFRHQGNRLERLWDLPAEISASELTLDDAIGLEQPDLILLNDRDLTYAKLEFDERSLDTILRYLDKLDEPLTRAIIWSQLWNMTRDATLPAAQFVGAVTRFARSETDDGVVGGLLEQAAVAVRQYAPASARAGLWDQLSQATQHFLAHSDGASQGQLLAWARNACLIAQYYRPALPYAVELLAGNIVSVDVDFTWRVLFAQACWGELSEDRIQQALAKDSGAIARLGAERSRAANPDPRSKAAVWVEIFTDFDLSNDRISARIAGFKAGPPSARAPYCERYFEALLDTWNSRSNEIASRIVSGLFPMGDATSEIHSPAQEPHVIAAQNWLNDHSEAPTALRRLVVESLDQLKRNLTAQLKAEPPLV